MSKRMSKSTSSAPLPQALLCLALLASASSSFAQSFFSEPAAFKVSKTCKASTNTKGSKGVLTVHAGQSFQALGENAPTDGKFVYLDTDGTRRWLPLSCGSYASSKPPFADVQGGAGGQAPGSTAGNMPGTTPTTTCLPFFDTQSNPVKVKNGTADITPPAPAIDAFGLAVNQVCGPAGKATSRAEFVKLMKAHPSVLADVMRFTSGKVFGGQAATTNADAYLQELVKAWYEVKAFDHIFCGETEVDKKIGGLHFVGRYVQLQKTGEACRLPNTSSNEVVPGSVYSMGVKMKKRNGQFITHEIKGYGLSLSAADILKVATRALAENPTKGSASTACLQQFTDGSERYTTVFVRRQQGIRTFYPDATPDKAGTQPCKATWALN
jgi:Bacterial EndoU nuclease